MTSTTKKVLLITTFFALTYSINTHAVNGFEAVGELWKTLPPHDLKDPLIIASASLLGGIMLITYGVFNSYDLPFTLYDNIAFALRTHMSEEDLKKHRLANKIKSKAEIIIGSFLAAVGLAIFLCKTNTLEQNLSLPPK